MVDSDCGVAIAGSYPVLCANHMRTMVTRPVVGRRFSPLNGLIAEVLV